jgi:hypothetical protein
MRPGPGRPGTKCRGCSDQVRTPVAYHGCVPERSEERNHPQRSEERNLPDRREERTDSMQPGPRTIVGLKGGPRTCASAGGGGTHAAEA